MHEHNVRVVDASNTAGPPPPPPPHTHTHTHIHTAKAVGHYLFRGRTQPATYVYSRVPDSASLSVVTRNHYSARATASFAATILRSLKADEIAPKKFKKRHLWISTVSTAKLEPLRVDVEDDGGVKNATTISCPPRFLGLEKGLNAFHLLYVFPCNHF